MRDFDWDEGNLEHATRHGVSKEEIEEAFDYPLQKVVGVPRIKRKGEDRFVCYSRTQAGRAGSSI